MTHIVHVLIGDGHSVADAAVKTSAPFLTATMVFRLIAGRTLAEFVPFDWIAAVASGAIVGRAATATDTSWLAATVALISLLLTHCALARLRFVPAVRKLIDPPLHVLIRDGCIDRRSLRRCGLTTADLQAVLRQHGQCNVDNVHLAVFEANGAISIVPAAGFGPASPAPARTAAARHSLPSLWRRCPRPVNPIRRTHRSVPPKNCGTGEQETCAP
jgi:uncharacterized membrane protein YcaP (DUF421 family)